MPAFDATVSYIWIVFVVPDFMLITACFHIQDGDEGCVATQLSEKPEASGTGPQEEEEIPSMDEPAVSEALPPLYDSIYGL